MNVDSFKIYVKILVGYNLTKQVVQKSRLSQYNQLFEVKIAKPCIKCLRGLNSARPMLLQQQLIRLYSFYNKNLRPLDIIRPTRKM
jgi:hypothetical protein